MSRTHIAEAQKQRHKIKEKGSRYVPGTVQLQVLGSGAAGTPSSVYLFTDQDRFVLKLEISKDYDEILFQVPFQLR